MLKSVSVTSLPHRGNEPKEDRYIIFRRVHTYIYIDGEIEATFPIILIVVVSRIAFTKIYENLRCFDANVTKHSTAMFECCLSLNEYTYQVKNCYSKSYSTSDQRCRHRDVEGDV